MSRSFRTGLAVFGVLSLLDLLLPLLNDGEHPPMPIALVASLLGIASLALVVSAWRGAPRAVIPLVILRLVSALSAVPALFEPTVPPPVVGAAATGITLTVVASILVLGGARPAHKADVR